MNHEDSSCDVYAKMRLWSGTTLPVPVFMVVPVNLIWHGGFCEDWVGDVLLGFPEGRYPVWGIHDNVTMLITFEASNVRDNFVLYVLVPGSGNSDPLHWTSC